MQIHGPAHLHGPQQVNAPHKVQSPSPSPSPSQSGNVQEVDQLDISETAQALSKIRDVPDIRHERVAQIRTQIAEGTYETADKLEAAVERLLDEIG